MIFLGAGASAPFGIPTAETLTIDIRNLLTKEHPELLHDIDDFWIRVHRKEANYENILTFLMGLTDLRRIPRHDEIRVFVTDHKEHRADYGKIIDEMYSKIVTYCTAPFVSDGGYLSAEELEDIFRLTYDIFALMSNEVVFTTNYDPSIEIWCQKRNIQLYDNTKTTRNPEIKEALAINNANLANGDTNLRLRAGRGQVPSLKIVRLHGSVWNYKTGKGNSIKMNRPRDRLLFTDWYPHLNKRPLLIFPGQESALESGEWDVLYQYFKTMLQGNCLVIGYSFQDNVINRAFINNLNEGQLKTIVILSPNPSGAAKNLFWDRDQPRRKIFQISAKFGTSGALQGIRNVWFNRVLNTSMPNVNGLLSMFRKDMRNYID